MWLSFYSTEDTIWKCKERCEGDPRHIEKVKNVDVIAGAVCVDHVHLSVAISLKLNISKFMGYLKGKSTLMIYDRHPEFLKQILLSL